VAVRHVVGTVFPHNQREASLSDDQMVAHREGESLVAVGADAQTRTVDERTVREAALPALEGRRVAAVGRGADQAHDVLADAYAITARLGRARVAIVDGVRAS